MLDYFVSPQGKDMVRLYAGYYFSDRQQFVSPDRVGSPVEELNAPQRSTERARVHPSGVEVARSTDTIDATRDVHVHRCVYRKPYPS